MLHILVQQFPRPSKTQIQKFINLTEGCLHV